MTISVAGGRCVPKLFCSSTTLLSLSPQLLLRHGLLQPSWPSFQHENSFVPGSPDLNNHTEGILITTLLALLAQTSY